MVRLVVHLSIALSLTALTQVGGIAWLIALYFNRRWLAFIASYSAISLAAIWGAPSFGRVALSCVNDGPLQVQSWVYCALNRNYVVPELAAVLADTAAEMDRRYPGTVTNVLDAGFPFLDDFPLLPHLSHDDGAKVDIAFYYADETGYLPGETRAPLGYFAFEDGPTECPRIWPSLRWNLDIVQPLWRDLALESARMQAIMRILSVDDRVGKILVEPHLVDRLGVAHPKVRFQGCRAARHDDHIHVQL